MFDWEHRNDGATYRRNRINGLFGYFNLSRDHDPLEEALDLNNPHENPYIMALGTAVTLSAGFTGLMRDIEARIHQCPTAQLYALLVNRYNPEYTVSGLFGYARSEPCVEAFENAIRENICHAAISELEHRMVSQANRLTDWDIAGRLLISLPDMPRTIQFGDDDAVRILGRIRLAYAWDIVKNRRPAMAPPMKVQTLYGNGLDLMDCMPELEEPLKLAYPSLVKRDKPTRTKYFISHSDELLRKLGNVLYGHPRYDNKPSTEADILNELRKRCRAIPTDFDVEYGNFDDDFWRGEPFPTKEFIEHMWAACVSVKSSMDSVTDAAIDAASEFWAEYDHKPAEAPSEADNGPSRDFLGQGVPASEASPEDVSACPSCGALMFIGGICENCGYGAPQDIPVDESPSGDVCPSDCPGGFCENCDGYAAPDGGVAAEPDADGDWDPDAE